MLNKTSKFENHIINSQIISQKSKSFSNNCSTDIWPYCCLPKNKLREMSLACFPDFTVYFSYGSAILPEKIPLSYLNALFLSVTISLSSDANFHQALMKRHGGLWFAALLSLPSGMSSIGIKFDQLLHSEFPSVVQTLILVNNFPLTDDELYFKTNPKEFRGLEWLTLFEAYFKNCAFLSSFRSWGIELRCCWWG